MIVAASVTEEWRGFALLREIALESVDRIQVV